MMNDLNSSVCGNSDTTKSHEDTTNRFIGDAVIIRTYSAGVWFGILVAKNGREVVLGDARRMYRWWAKETISLSGCAKYGVVHEKSNIVEPVDQVWLEAIEILPCTPGAADSLRTAPKVPQK